MASSVDIRVGVLGLREFATAMGTLGNRTYDRSQRKAVTFIAKDYNRFKTAKVASDIDRPTGFTRRAYDWDGASRAGDIFSRAFVRPKQARYLDIVETGGSRSRSGGRGPLGPKPDVRDRFGGLYGRKGLEKRFLSKSRAKAAAAAAGHNGIGSKWRTGQTRYAVFRIGKGSGNPYGLWEMRRRSPTARAAYSGRGGLRFGGKYEARWRTRLIVKFEQQVTYRPQLHFVDDARTYARQRFPALSLRLFNEELRRALQ